MSGAVLLSLLPPGPDVSLYDFAPVARAGEEAAYHRDEAAAAGARGSIVLSEAAVVFDADAAAGGAETVELLSSGPRVALAIPCAAALPLLALHVKDVGRFCAVEVEALDAAGGALRLTLSNRATTVRVLGAAATLPLELVPGWNMVRVDLADAVRRVWGRDFAEATCVTVTASCRVARVYFEARPLADAELPPFLRTLP